MQLSQLSEQAAAQPAAQPNRWSVDAQSHTPVLTHYCDNLRAGDTNSVLRQDIGGGYVRCERCGQSYLHDAAPGSTHLLMRVAPMPTPPDTPSFQPALVDAPTYAVVAQTPAMSGQTPATPGQTPEPSRR